MSTTTFRTGNPAFRESVFQEARYDPEVRTNAMTVQGAAVKSLVLVGLVVAAAVWTWSQTLVGLPAVTTETVRAVRDAAGVFPDALVLYIMGGCIGGLIVAVVTTFAPRLSPWTAPIYAVLEGL